MEYRVRKADLVEIAGGVTADKLTVLEHYLIQIKNGKSLIVEYLGYRRGDIHLGETEIEYTFSVCPKVSITGAESLAYITPSSAISKGAFFGKES